MHGRFVNFFRLFAPTAINMLKDQSPGTFIVRDSNSFPGAFGLALKVATPPPHVAGKNTSDPSSELVRHFLIEPTSKGVRIKGCSNEPVFGERQMNTFSFMGCNSTNFRKYPSRVPIRSHLPALGDTFGFAHQVGSTRKRFGSQGWCLAGWTITS